MLKDIDDRERKRLKRSIIIEDTLILLSIAMLFLLGVLYRHHGWAQIILFFVFLLMLAVFIRRTRRVKREFRRQQDQLNRD